jgi:hypothetical protein
MFVPAGQTTKLSQQLRWTLFNLSVLRRSEPQLGANGLSIHTYQTPVETPSPPMQFALSW